MKREEDILGCGHPLSSQNAFFLSLDDLFNVWSWFATSMQWPIV